MPTKIKPNTINPTKVILQLVHQVNRLVAVGITDLTNNSGGSAGTVVANSVALVNVAASGSNLADKTTTEAAINLYKDALVELYAKANTFATKLNIPNVTYNGGGAAADGTIAAQTVAVTGAATGVQATDLNATFKALNEATYNLVVLVNKIAKTQGHSTVPFAYQGKVVATVAAITVSGGTAASPGVTKVAVDAELVKLQTAIATIAARINTFNDGVNVAQVVAL